MSLHHLIMKSFAGRGFPPTIAELAQQAGASEEETRKALQALAEAHGVVLHPKSKEVWIAHPFSGQPQGWWVEGKKGAWFSNCIWCAFGVCHLTGGPHTIHTLLGGEKEKLVIEAGENGPEGGAENLLAYFTLPPARAWDNVMYFCATLQVFRGAGQAASWRKRHRFPEGALVPLDKVWKLAGLWYGPYLKKDWRKWTVSEAQEIFKKSGLTGDFWKLGDGGGSETY